MRRLLITLLLSVAAFALCMAQPATMDGDWKMLPERSSEIDLYSTVALRITHSGDLVTVVQNWGGARGFRDSVTLPSGGTTVTVPVRDRVWPTNVFMGVSMQPGKTKAVSARTEQNGRVLYINERYSLLVSQGMLPYTVENVFTLSADGSTLTWRIRAADASEGVRAHVHFCTDECPHGLCHAYDRQLGN